MLLRLLLFVASLSLVACSDSKLKDEDVLLVYDSSALSDVADKPLDWKDDVQWVSALPLGNGSLGAMVYGDVVLDRIQLNEESMWSGSPQDSDNPEALKAKDALEGLLADGKYAEAQELAACTQVCKGVGTNRAKGYEKPYGSFQTLGDLWIDLKSGSDYTNYRRSLNLNRAEVNVSYMQDGVTYKREYFVSYPDQVMVVRLSADKAKSLSFTAKLNRPERYATHTGSNQLIMTGTLNDGKGGNGLHYVARLKAVPTGGEVVYTDSTLIVNGADEVMLLLAASTDYKLEYPYYTGRDYQQLTQQRIEQAAEKSYQELKRRHLDDFMSLFGRSNFSLKNSSGNRYFTDSLLYMAKNDSIDARLYELSFSYGKYLLLTSSRPGSLPANLQGVWTNKVNSPWNGDYHININLPMNYWPAEVMNIAETHQPLFDFIKSVAQPGKRTAQVHYGLHGWTLHPCTNIWGFTSPGEGISWGYYPIGAAWMCLDILEHYRFTGDKQFLQDMYITLEGAVRFLSEWLVKDAKTGQYLAGPSSSPENAFVVGGVRSNLTLATSHAQQLIWQLFTDFMEASKVLNISSEVVSEVSHKLKHLTPTPIGKDGRLMEWNVELEESDKGHRHLSHLVGLYPGHQFNTIHTPEYVEAAKKSIDCRVEHGCGYVGWSGAWLAGLNARLKRPEQAVYSLNMVIKRMLPNLFNLGAPFQIEGNFGVSAGIAEMLLQSHIQKEEYRVIDILPALPKEWNTGHFKGLRARGNFEVDASWKKGDLKALKVTSLSGNKCMIMYKNNILFKGELLQNKSYKIDV